MERSTSSPVLAMPVLLPCVAICCVRESTFNPKVVCRTALHCWWDATLNCCPAARQISPSSDVTLACTICTYRASSAASNPIPFCGEVGNGVMWGEQMRLGPSSSKRMLRHTVVK